MGRIITFEPIQEGEGTPSPDNIRPILPGLTIDGIGDIYGGSVDFDTGMLTKMWYCAKKDGTTNVASDIGTHSDTSEFTRCRGLTWAVISDWYNDVPYNDTSCFKCSHFFWYTYQRRRLLTPDVSIAWTTSGRVVRLCSSTFTTLEEYNDWLKEQYDNGTPVVTVVKRSAANYETIQLTPEQLTEAYNQLVVTPPSMLEKRRRMIMSQPHLASESANPLTFQTDISANLKDCKIYFEPVQEGSGDPSPENVRPISGWDGVTIVKNWFAKINNYETSANGITFTRKPKNDGTVTIKGTATAKVQRAFSGNFIANGNNYIFQNFPVLSGGLYWYVWDMTSSTMVTDGGNILDLNGRKLKPTSGHEFVVAITIPKNATVDLTFKPVIYDETEAITIPFPQTIYGGYVDLVKGEVVEEWRSEMMSSYTWTNHSTSSSISRWKCSDIPVKPASTKNDAFHGISDRLLPIAYNGSWNSYYRISPSSDGYSNTFVILPPMTAQEANDFFATALLCYELASPITHQLTPQTIKTLKGVNNIWSDANGNVELRFWKH